MRDAIREDEKRFRYAKEMNRNRFYAVSLSAQKVMISDPKNKNGAFWPCKGFVSLDKYISKAADNGDYAYALPINKRSRKEIFTCFCVNKQVAMMIRSIGAVVLEAGDYLLFNNKKQFSIIDAERFHKKYLICNRDERNAFIASIKANEVGFEAAIKEIETSHTR